MKRALNLLEYTLIFSFFLVISLPVFAGKEDAKSILDQTAAAFRRSSGVRASFVIQTYVKNKMQNSSSGNICLKGDKFLLDAEGIKTWFDGRTQWSYVANTDEVNVAEPTSDELQGMNPYAFLSIYKKGYNLKLGNKSTYAGKSAYEVILTAKDKKQDIQCIILYVTKDNLEPLCVSMGQRGGNSVAVRINFYQTGLSYSDSMFTFNKKDYPSAEYVDLR